MTEWTSGQLSISFIQMRLSWNQNIGVSLTRVIWLYPSGAIITCSWFQTADFRPTFPYLEHKLSVILTTVESVILTTLELTIKTVMKNGLKFKTSLIFQINLMEILHLGKWCKHYLMTHSNYWTPKPKSYNLLENHQPTLP